MLQLVLAATASAPVTSAILGEGGRARYDKELARIAHASLFCDASAPRRTPRPKRPTKR
jgi:hypothetical protein